MPLIIIDCGSALTLDRLDPDGGHRGGAIWPGLAMMNQALDSATHALDPVALPDDLAELPALGRDTVDGIQSGILAAAVGGIEYLRARALAPAEAHRCLITGGDGARIQPLLRGETLWVPDLVFRGLRAYAEARAH